MRSIVDEPFHEGERAVQERIGVRARLAEVGPHLMRPFLTEQHREFFPLLDFVVVGVVDDGVPRATVVAGGAGFATSETPTTLSLSALPSPADPARARLVPGAPVGVLGLQPHTRRRNRVNGVVAGVDDKGFVVDVRQTFGNCPKFITARSTTTTTTTTTAQAATVTRAASLSDEDVAFVAGADTFYVASAHPNAGDAGDGVAARGVDVSHRGGRAGFVGVDDGGVLWVPDFQGNFYFNTIGNLVVNPRAGLVFVGAHGRLLQLSVEVEILWDGSVVDAFAGAERVLKMRVTEVVRLAHAHGLVLGDGAPSPFSLTTGTWR